MWLQREVSMIDVVANSMVLRSGRGDSLRYQPWMQQPWMQQPIPELPPEHAPEITPPERGPDITPQEPPEITPDVTPDTPPEVTPIAASASASASGFTWRRIRHGEPSCY